MGTLLFGRTQDAYGTPFDPTDPEAIAAGLESNTVQKAIIEAKNDAINNDRYPFQAVFNGNANTGRYLEIFPAVNTLEAPFVFPEASAIRTVTMGATSVSNAVVGFFRTTNLVTPVFTLPYAGLSRVVFTNLFFPFAPLDELAIRITSGSASKPFLRVWVNTVT